MAKPELGVLKTYSYDRHWGPHGNLTDWVTESEYIDTKSLAKEEFQDIILKDHQISGQLNYRKFRMTYGDGSVYYRHVLEEVQY